MLPNIGLAVASQLRRLGIRKRSDLATLGPVEVYRRLRAEHEAGRGPAPSLRFHLFGLEAALSGIRISDLPRSRRTALVRAALGLPEDGPLDCARPKHVIRRRPRGQAGRRP